MTDKCVNCGTTRFPLPARNLCSRCYPLVLKKESAQEWDMSQPDTLAKCDIPTVDPVRFSELKGAYLEIIEDRLDIFRFRETFINGGADVDGITIERQLLRIAEKAGAKDAVTLTHGWKGRIDDSMDANARSCLYGMLCMVEEEMEKPWKGLHLGELFEHVRQSTELEKAQQRAEEPL